MAAFTDLSKGARQTRDKAPRGKASKPASDLLTPAQIEKAMGGMLDAVSFVFLLRGDVHCSTHFSQSPEREGFIKAWRKMAESNAAVRRVLSLVLSTGTYTECIIASLAFTIPVAQHHGIYPKDWINPFSMNPDNIGAMMGLTEEDMPPNGTGANSVVQVPS